LTTSGSALHVGGPGGLVETPAFVMCQKDVSAPVTYKKA